MYKQSNHVNRFLACSGIGSVIARAEGDPESLEADELIFKLDKR